MKAARGRSPLTPWLAFAIVLSALPAVGRAEGKTLVLLEIEGEPEPRLGKSLERLVKTQHEIMRGSVYRDAAGRLRAKKLTPNNVKKVCAYLKVDGVIDGTVVQDDASTYRFIVRLRSGATGIIEKKIPMRLTQPRLSEEMFNQLAQRLLTAIDELPAVDKDGREGTLVAAGAAKLRAEDEAEVEEEQAADAAKGKKGRGKLAKGEPEEVRSDEEELDKPERVASAREEEEGLLTENEGAARRSALKASAVQEEEEDELEGEVEEEVEEAPPGANTPRTTPLLVNAGVSFVGRKLSFSYSGTDPAEAPPGFDGTPVPGAYVVGEVYPAGFSGGRRGVLADIGLGFVIDRVIKLNSTLDDGTGGTVSLATRMWRYGANLRYRHNFGPARAANGYSVQASLGYNRAGFSIDKGSAPGGSDSVDVPNVHYKYVDVGVGGRIPIVGNLSLLAEAKFLAPLDTGSIQEAEQYGGASVKGFDTEAALEYQITGNFMARAGGRLMVMSYSFDGNGALDDRDGNGQVDVSGASDRYLGAFLTGGYSF